MSALIQEATIKVRQDTAGNWTSSNPTLSAGEWGLETDTSKVKIGDGSTAWTSLEYTAETGLVEQVATNTANLPDSTKQLCKAWVNFDGTTNVGGFCTIRDSYNVTSVTDNGTGDYTINFTNAMTDANYSALNSCSQSLTTTNYGIDSDIKAQSTTSINIRTGYNVGSPVAIDAEVVNVQIFGS